VYPLAVTGISQVAFCWQANGSAVSRDGKFVGSELIGQQFEQPKYFWGRPSATGPFPYNAMASSGSNLGPTNPALVGGVDGDGKEVQGAIQERIAALRSADRGNTDPIPTDLATASGSGLDPNISVAAAEYQMGRVARARRLNVEVVRNAIKRATQLRQFGILGEPVINVLHLNLDLDRLELTNSKS
jgi:K+-transporting ATPase ATPase C chain